MFEKMKLNVGILGSGYWAKAHARSYQQIDGFNLIGVSSRTLKNAKEFAKQFNIEYYLSFEDLLGDPKIDLVSIVLPPYLHKKYTIMAAEKSKHIFCEKTPAISLEELKKIFETIERTKIKYLVGYIERFNPISKKIKEFLIEETIGEPRFIYSSRMGYSKGTGWKLKEKLGGGILNLLASHDLDLIPWLFDTKIKLIHCSMNKLYSLGYDNLLIDLETKNKIKGLIRCDWGWIRGERILHLIGTSGSIYADYKQSIIEIWNNKTRDKKTIKIKKILGLNLEMEYLKTAINDSNTDSFLINKEQLKHGFELIEKSYESNKKHAPIQI
jgi:UDP-N-acetylglucosamine 3-dehydrogenase